MTQDEYERVREVQKLREELAVIEDECPEHFWDREDVFNFASRLIDRIEEIGLVTKPAEWC